jgi:periplasmic protein TonB
MSRRMNLTLPVILAVAASGVAAHGQALTPSSVGGHHYSYVAAFVQQGNDREQDGLQGPVRRVKTETAKITVKNGKPLEGPRVLLETTTYDNKGTKVDNAYFLAAGGSLTGKEVYKYDDKGNIVEMTLTNEDGTLQARELYIYEFDAVGNWTKMTTNVAMIEGGRLSYEPTEVTYRTIAYYLDEAMVAKMSQPAVQPAATNAGANPAAMNANAGAQPSKAPAATNPAPAAVAKKENNVSAALPLNIASTDKPAAAVAPASLTPNTNPVGAGPVVKVEGEAPADGPPRPARSGPLKPVSGGILNGKALRMPMPMYPELARRARLSGMVDVEVVIDVTGKVISAKAVKGPALLHAAAEQAAKNARFSPTLLSGQPVRVTGTISYNFNLSQ